MSVSVAVLGIHGFGRFHLQALASLEADGLAQVIGVADPRGRDGVEHLRPDVPCFSSLDQLLQHRVPDVVVIATPIHTHADLAIRALQAGSHVFLEKPTTSSLAAFNDVVNAASSAGKAVQVGFQSFGSQAIPAIGQILQGGEIGELTGIAGVGTWSRDRAYYHRSAWAGRRVMQGVWVVDGVVTNPLAHCVATALLADGSTRVEDVVDVEVDLYRAHDIEADDTSSVRVRTHRGTSLTFGLTLCAPEHTEPEIIVQGTAGTIRVGYTRDLMTITSEGERTIGFERTCLIRNLIEHINDPAVALLAGIEDTGAFMRVLEAVRTAPAPAPVNDDYVRWVGEGDTAHPVIEDIRAWCLRVATEHRLFRELGAPWIRS
ncbi:MAG: Gfo/Idh/MocA family protein [Beutenbergiaceae bacterium]